MNKQLKVALVCDWLTGIGGAERVVLELHKMFPQAPIYTSQYNKNPEVWYGDKWFSDADVRTLWLQHLPKSIKKFLPVLRAWSFSHLDLSEYDLVISSSSAEAKAVKTGSQTKHITYCHAPTHYYWARYNQYMKNPGFGFLTPLARLGLRILVGPMRRWDHKAAQKPDYFLANSNFTKAQIKKYYGRESTVIYPPVDVKRFTPKDSSARSGFLAAGRQTPYKRVDLAVSACTKLDEPLAVIGNGPQHNKLVSMAGPSVSFLTKVADEGMPRLFQSAEAFIFPGLDDFGIVAVEALAAGTPVIAYKDGGALDYIKEGQNGLFFNKPTEDSLIRAIEKFKTCQFSSFEINKSVTMFTPENFRQQLSKFLKTI